MRVNELAGERAGESEPAITTTYYVLYVTVREYSKTEANGIPSGYRFSNRVSQRNKEQLEN